MRVYECFSNHGAQIREFWFDRADGGAFPRYNVTPENRSDRADRNLPLLFLSCDQGGPCSVFWLGKVRRYCNAGDEGCSEQLNPFGPSMPYGLKTSRRSYAGDKIPLPRFKARALMNNSQNVVQNNTLWTPSEIELLP